MLNMYVHIYCFVVAVRLFDHVPVYLPNKGWSQYRTEMVGDNMTFSHHPSLPTVQTGNCQKGQVCSGWHTNGVYFLPCTAFFFTQPKN